MSALAFILIAALLVGGFLAAKRYRGGARYGDRPPTDRR